MTAAPAATELLRQHVIDPEVCIRCNTCEEMCPIDAITHDDANYVVDFAKCEFCGDCLSPCPTGAIDNWRKVTKPYTLEEQFGWEELPAELDIADLDLPAGGGPIPEDVQQITDVATEGGGGRDVPPWSAAHPYVNLYTPEEPALATIAGNLRLTDDNASTDIHHIVLDFGKTAFPVIEGQSVGIVPPGTDAEGKPHHVRLYSVASPRDGERPGYNNIALTVKRITEDNDGKPVKGVASNYLCDLEKGAEVKVTGPFGTTFLMPNNPGSKIVMICTGTGSAPMRAMTERARRQRQRGYDASLYLFFGARTPGELPYLGPLGKLPKDLIDVQLAYSRQPGATKEYVQDRILACADTLGPLLQDEDTFVYVCGHKRMEDGVNAAMSKICEDNGLDWATLRGRFRKGGRYHVETYY